MKKTLIALLALGSMAMAYDNVVWTSATTASGTVAKGNYQGFSFTIANTVGNRAASTPSVEGATLPSIVYLDSIAFGFASDATLGNYTRDVLLLNSENVVISSLNNTVCKNSEDADRMFTLTGFGKDVVLNVGATYYVVFANKNAVSADGDMVGETLTDTTVLSGNDLRLAVIGAGATDAEEWGVLSPGSTSEITSKNYAPKLKITTRTPEPATTTLSLLALAGLASRRRRH